MLRVSLRHPQRNTKLGLCTSAPACPSQRSTRTDLDLRSPNFRYRPNCQRPDRNEAWREVPIALSAHIPVNGGVPVARSAKQMENPQSSSRSPCSSPRREAIKLNSVESTVRYLDIEVTTL
jgi:hypothetical protein